MRGAAGNGGPYRDLLFSNKVERPLFLSDNAILRIENTYDDMSRTKTITSYNATTGGTAANKVEYSYNGYGLVSETKQAHNGVVDVNTPSVVYNYDDGDVGGVAKYVRLTSIKYPDIDYPDDGRQVHYLYPTTGIGNALNRVESIADDASGTTKYAQYEYLGAGTIVSVAHPGVTGGLTLDYNISGSTHLYEGWDTFGRVINQQWTNSAGTSTLDHYTYSYDRNSNRTSRTNELRTTLSEMYLYDDLDRLQDVNRGGSDYQSWGLDSLGNWNTVTDDVASTTETRTANDANEIASISGTGIQPTYDDAGNMITGPKPGAETTEHRYIYDAWNRLAKVTDDQDATIATYEYDGQGRRIVKVVSSETRHFYYSAGSQVLEEREDSETNADIQYVWGTRYIDDLILRDRDADNNDTSLEERLYALQDANWNVTAIVNTSGAVQQRFLYDPYGNATSLNADFTTYTGTNHQWEYTYTSRRLDNETGLMFYRARYYHTELGRFINRDPIGYRDGTNVYSYVAGRPISSTDPSGLFEIRIDFNAFIPLSKGTPIAGAKPADVNWGIEPGQWFSTGKRRFATDNREKAGAKGTSRMYLTAKFESTQLGALENRNGFYFFGSAGASYQMSSKGVVKSKTSKVTVTEIVIDNPPDTVLVQPDIEF